jgi:flagellar basal body rod protein FlgB
MQNAKTTCDELKAFYNSRAALEDEYARKLSALCRKPLGSGETGTLRTSFDVLRGEVESMSKQHALIASQMKSELEEPLAAFAGGMKERRKIVQTGIERLLKTKQAQTAHVNKSRDKYEQDCLRIKGYLAQGHMVMGQEERKNKAKLEKTQINMASNSNEYEAAIKVLEETIGRWNKEWKAACDVCQSNEF